MSLTSRLRKEIAFHLSFGHSLRSLANEAKVPYSSLHKFVNAGKDLQLRHADRIWSLLIGNFANKERLQFIVRDLIAERMPPEHRFDRRVSRLAERLVDPVLKMIDKTTDAEVRKMKMRAKQK